MAANTLTNGHGPPSERIRSHQQEKNLPGGWVVLKFGGTSVGKFAENIASIVKAGVSLNRVAIVCSARSSELKLSGTTNRLLRVANEAKKDGRGYDSIIQDIRVDHHNAAEMVIQDKDSLEAYKKDVDDECNHLARICESAQYLQEVSPGVEDKIISKGEKLACRFMTTLLRDRGVGAEYMDLSSIIDPEMDFGDHFYKDLSQTLGKHVLEKCEDRVPVITGFFGPVPGSLLTTVGRGYTDLCAALVAIGVNANELQIWKEVDGIFTADPRKVPTARLLPAVTPSEAAELTFYGSEVIHPFTMEQVINADILIRVKNVMNQRNPGTVIAPDPKPESPKSIPGTPGTPGGQNRVIRSRALSAALRNTQKAGPKRPTAVTIKHNVIVLNVHSNKRTRAHGFLMKIFSILDRWNLSVDLISSSEVHVSLAIHSESALLSGGGQEEYFIANSDLEGAVLALEEFSQVQIAPDMAIISLVGKQLKNMIGIAGKFFSTLGENNINIEMISQGASEINISCVIEEREADRALNVVHTNLFTFLE